MPHTTLAPTRQRRPWRVAVRPSGPAVSARLAGHSLILLLFVTGVLWAYQHEAGRHAQAVAGEAATHRTAQCKRLGDLLVAPAPALGSAPALAMTPEEIFAIEEARRRCLLNAAESAAFRGFPTTSTPSAAASRFFLSPDSAGHWVTRTVLAVLYAVFVGSLAVVAIWLFESRTGSLSETIDRIRQWFSPGSSGASSASALGTLAATTVVATPAVLGVSMALQAEPLDLRINTRASESELTIHTRVLPPATRLPIEVVPIVVGTSTASLPRCSIQSNASTTAGAGGRKGTQKRPPLISLPTLEQRLLALVEEQQRLNASLGAIAHQPIRVKVDGVHPPLAVLPDPVTADGVPTVLGGR